MCEAEEEVRNICIHCNHWWWMSPIGPIALWWRKTLWLMHQLCPVHTLTIYCLVCIMVKWLRSLFHPNIFRFDIKYFQSFINLLWATGDRKINIYKLNNIILQYFCTRHSLSAPNVYCTCAHLFKLQMAQLHTYIPYLLIIGPWPWSVHGGWWGENYVV